ncbi:tyrosine-type recombinase/integrase [Clostridium swellfunianum]|uniref:site-specific integrase n=1 Tax=Clostridium swellfunianum TaxID=1367462 RepID=UPI00202EEC84|nr:site-specific integrase [Clostridium swellfunianum]MCM0646785.1 tyrosine-type recombinase/integrase [Clostridium swellfunianum]MCM0649716.1 tyrosine-type recombinase/integrase [Clostridium swellfunianum]MCM0650033.1 tyrosine-type recombinase/integrase [Clostridium swellfunianum]MCM0651109.1 tyrosine-type recombinase/integrase [Clostridium swellfunianum]
MAEREYAISTIKNHRGVLNSLLKFMKEKNITKLTEEVGMDYIKCKTGTKLQGFWGSSDRKTGRVMKPVQNLLIFMETGELSFFIRSHIQPFICPPGFEKEYKQFQQEYQERNYADATIVCNNNIIHKLLTFLDEKGISNSGKITSVLISKFLANYEESKPKYVATVVYVLRNYLSFLKEAGFIKIDIASSLPHIRILRNAFIPYSWKTEDVKKLLSIIDRGDPKGKRDFAILLLIVRLGLRVSDIRRMQLSNLNWSRKTISIIMQKTCKAIELPILDDIGWALIDYLKNGRPRTASNRIFVRHRAPFDAFGENECFQRELRRYMEAAGINIPSGVICGMHSLRSTLAKNMLEAKAPLSVISETLGHQSINTTSIYIKIDIEGLRKCALDPEEVFQ